MAGEFTDVDKVLASETGSTGPGQRKHLTTDKYRPVRRPPMGLLDLFDDGQNDAERIRIRADITTVGRTGCDVCIPHDAQIASVHLKILRELVGKRWRWSLESQGDSALYVRVRRSRLRHHSEFLAGNQLFQFRAGSHASKDAKEALGERLARGSIPGEQLDVGLNCPSILQMTGDNKRPLWLLGNEFWIGRAPECALSIPDDRFLAPQHVRLVKKDDGEWEASTNKVPNGLWIRVKSINVQSTCTFQIGEQRMRFSVC